MIFDIQFGLVWKSWAFLDPIHGKGPFIPETSVRAKGPFASLSAAHYLVVLSRLCNSLDRAGRYLGL